tara:strand:+ start:137 stop:787 length:651 start_codon:yes stop_codon:yes gene_type:complete
MTNVFDINQIYKNLLGREVQDEGKNFWTSEYNKAIANNQSHAQAVSGIEGAIAQTPEYSTPFATHRRKAVESVSKDHGTYPTFSDIYIQNDDGSVSPNPTWKGELDWYKNYAAGGGGGVGGQQYEKYDDSALLDSISGLTSDLSGLRDAFDKYKTDMDKMWANANWGTGATQQQSTVQGVKTQNELPGWTPKTGGSAGFFGRGGNRFGLTTGSLNI